MYIMNTMVNIYLSKLAYLHVKAHPFRGDDRIYRESLRLMCCVCIWMEGIADLLIQYSMNFNHDICKL